MGIEHQIDVKKYVELNCDKLIFGLETIQNYYILDDGIHILGKNKIIVSIDMYKGKIYSQQFSVH